MRQKENRLRAATRMCEVQQVTREFRLVDDGLRGIR